MTALAIPEEETKVAEIATAITSIVTAAERLEVRTPQEAEAATEFLARVARAKKESESARTFLVKPLNDHAKRINARFKETTAPLEQADTIVRGKVIAFTRAEEQRRAEEQARLDREHEARVRAEEDRRRQEAAEAERQRAAAAREAARLEAETKAAAADQDERYSTLSFEELDEICAEEGENEAGRRAAAELERRERQADHDYEIAAARQREEDARAAEDAARNAPIIEPPKVQVAAPAALKSTSGSATTRKVWKFELDDETRVPREYLQVDEVLIRKAIREGVREIPGVRIYQDDELAVKAS